MSRRVYIETTIPSFYHEMRTEPEMVARRDWTREWWDERRGVFEPVTSEAVLRELENGQFPQKADALALIKDVPFLDIDEAIADIVDAYLIHHVMPADPAGDALHLAIWQSHPIIGAIFC
jgi:hypothetical protein